MKATNSQNPTTKFKHWSRTFKNFQVPLPRLKSSLKMPWI